MSSPEETRHRCAVATLRNAAISMGAEVAEDKDCCAQGECFIWDIPGITQKFRVASIVCKKAAKKRRDAVANTDMKALREAIAEHEAAKEHVLTLVKEFNDAK